MPSYPLEGLMMSSGLSTSWIQAGKAACGLGRDAGEWVESDREGLLELFLEASTFFMEKF